MGIGSANSHDDAPRSRLYIVKYSTDCGKILLRHSLPVHNDNHTAIQPNLDECVLIMMSKLENCISGNNKIHT